MHSRKPSPEIDLMEIALVERAARDALEELRSCNAGGVTRFFKSGKTLFRVRVSIVPEGEDTTDGSV